MDTGRSHNKYVEWLETELQTFEKEHDDPLKALVFVKARDTCIQLASFFDERLREHGIRVAYLYGKDTTKGIKGNCKLRSEEGSIYKGIHVYELLICKPTKMHTIT